MIKIIFLPAVLLLISCQMSSNVRIRTVPDSGYDTYYNSEYIGRTPISIRASNYFGSDHEIEFRSKNIFLKRERLRLEWKPLNVFFSFLFYFLPMIWAYGPSEEQVFYLENTPALKAPGIQQKSGNTSKKASECEKSGPIIAVKPVFRKIRASSGPVLNFAIEDAVNHNITKLLKNYRGPQKKTVLVSADSLKNSNRNSEERKIARFIYSRAADAVFHSKVFTLIEREHINSLLKEKSLHLKGVAESDNSLNEAKLAGADLILFLSIHYNLLEGKIVELKTGEVLSYVTESISD